MLSRTAAYSRWLSARLNNHPDLEAWLLETLATPVARQDMQAFLATGISTEEDLKRQLRRLRERVFARVMARDLNGLADLSEVTRTLTELAEVTVRAAVDFHHRDLAEIHGEPLDSAGLAQQMIVVGMGKLGGGELNASSDIDLIFVFPEDGETAGGVGNTRVIANFEFFTRLGKRVINALDDMTADGYVFRVDMRLRPYGDGGPLASSFAMLESYFYTQAREWERYAWIKGRALTGDGKRIGELEKLRIPFVFRKYLDFGAFGSMRDLHAQIRREVARKDKVDNIKLGPGGIREIEFIAQVFQLIRGGKQASLRLRPTRTLLHQLAAYGLMPENQTRELEEAYVFLRNLEHRLQYLDDAQTQMLPKGEEDRQRVAVAMGFADWAALLARLAPMRRKVAGQFEQVFGAPQEDQSSHALAGLCELPEEEALERLVVAGFREDGQSALERLRALKRGSRYVSLPAQNKTALDGLLPPLVEVAARFPNPLDTLARILDLLEAICRRAPYLALLKEYPQTLMQLARILSSSPWAASYLARQPHLLDELLDSRTLMAAPDWQAARGQLRAQLENCAGDVEQQMDALRHFKQSETFRLLAQDLAGVWSVEKLSDHLADLADLLLDATLGLVWVDLKGRHREQPTFAVIAYGKLGGKELGYASDLDIVFLYDDPHPDAQEIYARLGKRLITWISTLTPAGILYDTDLRLRPDGASGLLVSSLEAFTDYQRDKAWTWEHQALTRARYCCGDRAVGERFAEIRENVLVSARDVEKLRADVLEMRQKMFDGHPNASGLFDLKHDRGGLVDVEFAVQYLVLAHAGQHPELLPNVGNIALLKRAGALELIPLEIALAAGDAYRELRARQHAVKLQGSDHARIEHGGLTRDVAAVKALWGAVFGMEG
ncbi:MAG: bifunctional [glutamate--ammonia ligase]-adenylyl-L-tyrosine phosphorylase/[glutamate--ammonia-ligase] adenylyltransferase [Pseudomonadota bacterium]|nr:bifunctional [glutamate--ammonia ligase]-adenylyl-L-tyrosine phosphorylase/[glutamate--ammonia-ligase] adenylyltransferase [Pseudomonadota bacterium]MDP1904124.1 bifunctional [glutamate--ammonia ligase]-adenylyl-L-tyrosine phosphorylase/[glutamate--ammonia-ligase] adenylyltransferase [Pseudomonadota bacterium]MDP2353706.1 bifunctional [glutamate--ammonia ligase]-adenylyl-L-tyrosine phosphorylase/[glutamate--ammonia-ligase] adenylyltransferase [Pseudomonadota bacterium]